MYEWTEWQSQSPRKAVLVAQALAPTVRSGNSGFIESLTCQSKPDTARPTQLISTGRGCSHQPGHPSQELDISSAGASRTRTLTTGSPALYQLTYGTGSYPSKTTVFGGYLGR